MIKGNAYKPIKSDKPDKKFYIITKSGKRVYFGSANASDYTIHKDPLRKDLYIKRHSKMGEDWNNPDTAGFWARWYLWEEPTKKEAYNKIKLKLNKLPFVSS